MPIYEFICNDCGQEFDERKEYGDYEANCPLCGAKGKKVMSAPNVITGKQTADVAIGADAERRWQAIEDRKNQRTKENFGSSNLLNPEIKQKETSRISNLLDRQNSAMTVINKAKQDFGVTKKDELNHALRGR